MGLQENEDGRLKVRAMGAPAVNQAVKGVIIARQMLAANGLDFDERLSFDSHNENGDDVTVIVFSLQLFEA
jgi:stage V sporulation protein SpoVS